MGKRTLCRKILCYALILSLLLLPLPRSSATAATTTEYTVMSAAAFGNLTEQTWAQLLLDGEDTYILAEDAALFSGFAVETSGDKAIFTRSGKTVQGQNAIHSDGKLWLPLESTMAELQTVCTVADGTLLLYGSNGTLEELLAAADEPLQNGGNSLDYIGGAAGTTGFVLATLWDILSVRGLIETVTLETTKSRYKEVVSDLMQPPDNEETLIELAEALNKDFKYVSKYTKHLQSAYDYLLGEEAVATNGLFLGIESSAAYMQAVEAYSGVAKCLDISGYLDTIQYYYSADTASELYVTMMEKSLLHPDYPREYRLGDMASDDFLYSAAQETVDYYKQRKLNIQSLVESAANDIIAAAGIMAVPIDIVTKLAKDTAALLMNAADIDKSLSAIKKTFSLKHIQDEARVGYNYALDKIKAGEVTEDSVSLLKYSAMLYLKAAHDAYALYSFDSTINTSMACSRLNEHIIALAGFDEEQICKKVENAKLDNGKMTAVDSEPAYGASLSRQQIDELWKSLEGCWIAGYPEDKDYVLSVLTDPENSYMREYPRVKDNDPESEGQKIPRYRIISGEAWTYYRQYRSDETVLDEVIDVVRLSETEYQFYCYSPPLDWYGDGSAMTEERYWDCYVDLGESGDNKIHVPYMVGLLDLGYYGPIPPWGDD